MPSRTQSTSASRNKISHMNSFPAYSADQTTQITKLYLTDDCISPAFLQWSFVTYVTYCLLVVFTKTITTPEYARILNLEYSSVKFYNIGVPKRNDPHTDNTSILHNSLYRLKILAYFGRKSKFKSDKGGPILLRVTEISTIFEVQRLLHQIHPFLSR